ncbi:uncharacterized protein LOC125682910 [Ostrea edulis]|uniref:uncharacterized protein LOC125682910 n=1 Tax=Ostrea edulis TaxID=37623 RepID=UPI0024AF695C|nr:uncharacterized protein LOC125682910 [Ostrea edulis]
MYYFKFIKKLVWSKQVVHMIIRYYFIGRLEAYDRNENFKEDPILLPEPLDVGWPVAGFKQILQEHKCIIPKITREQIEAYFLYRLADDRQCTGDLKALVKGQDMFDSNKVLACSVCIEDDIYLTGIVGASMKQKVTYNYKVRISRESGDPLNTHCECPAGRGPHGTCKHLAVVCIMLERFAENGTLRIAKSCTENLMSFNRPKSTYSGSPVKAEDLPSKKRPYEEFFEDPRPLKHRNNPSYNSMVQNIITNYCSQTSKDISMRYLYPRANFQVVSMMHDYGPLPLTEQMVDNALMVDERKIHQIEVSTRGQSRNSKWFEAREWRLTASRFKEVCKATCRRNTNKLCSSLMCSSIKTKAILHGKNYEKKALKLFDDKFCIKTKECGLFVCLDYPYLGASPDAVVDDSAIVEVKCSYSGKNEMVKPGAHFKYLMFDDNENVVLKKSHNYYDQIQGQLYISKRKFCYFVVFTLRDLFVQKIPLDTYYCEHSLLPKLKVFFEKYYRPFIASKL